MIVPAVIHPSLTVPLGAVILLGLLWYLRRTLQATMSPGRCRIRISSIVCVMLAVITLVTVLSFVSHRSHPLVWTSLWLVVLMLMLLIIILAVMDSMRNLTWYREEKHRAWDEMIDATRADVRNMARPELRENHDEPIEDSAAEHDS